MFVSQKCLLETLSFFKKLTKITLLFVLVKKQLQILKENYCTIVFCLLVCLQFCLIEILLVRWDVILCARFVSLQCKAIPWCGIISKRFVTFVYIQRYAYCLSAMNNELFFTVSHLCRGFPNRITFNFSRLLRQERDK